MNSTQLKTLLTGLPIFALALIVSPTQALAEMDALEAEQQQFLKAQAPDLLETEQQQFLKAQVPIRSVAQVQPIAEQKTAPSALEPHPQNAQLEPDRQPVPEPQQATHTLIPARKPNQAGSIRRLTSAKTLPLLTSTQGYSRVVPLPVTQRMPQAAAAPTPLTVVRPFVQKLALTLVPSFEPLLKGAETLLYPLVRPVEITSPFGWRVHPISGTTRLHTGVDFGAPIGTPILATLSGQVISADWMGGYGNAIVLEHSPGLRSLYAHLSESLVRPGQTIMQGTVIGLSGSTGNSTGPHLHFEIQRLTGGEWTAVDPNPDLKAAQKELASAMQRISRSQALR